MDFSIITPVLNQESFIEECLASVASQKGIRLEHWVIDGGSTDETLELISRFPHVKTVSEPDKGISDAINKGFDRARGEWVMWLNADDRLKPGALEAVLENLSESSADLVFGNWSFMNANGAILRDVRAARWSRFVHVHHHCLIASTACFLRRATIVDEGFRLRSDFHYVMDGEFYARLAAEGKVFERVNLGVADFRLHDDNASRRHLGRNVSMDEAVKAEKQHVESRAIRRVHGITLFEDPYLNGLVDGLLWIIARGWKAFLKLP